MGVREEDAPLREAVDVGRAALRVAAETADPVVQVVDRDEEDVRAGARGGRRLTA